MNQCETPLPSNNFLEKTQLIFFNYFLIKRNISDRIFIKKKYVFKMSHIYAIIQIMF